MMTPYEWSRLALEPFLPAVRGKARRRIRALAGREPIEILDVGGRKSPYTVGLDAQVTILDLPREREIQEKLGLGLNDELLRGLRRTRSNVARIVLEDMCRCSFPSESFDAVVSVEVIEHVPDVEAFLAQIHRVLKPGGWLFLTTPNGDYIPNEPPNHNPDHLRHFRRDELHALLSGRFSRAEVHWGVKTGKHRLQGLRSIHPRRPLQAIATMGHNLISQIESRGYSPGPRRNAHLFAVAWK